MTAGVDRTLSMLETLAQHPDGASLGTLAQALDLPKSVAHRLLRALAAHGYVLQDPPSQEYRLSLKLALLGFRYLDGKRLGDIAQPVLEELAREAHEYCRIALAEGEELAWIACAQGATAGLRYEPPMGREVVLHATATGKAWLASMPDEQALSIVARRGLATPPGFGHRAARTLEGLRRHLADARRRGYATAIEEGEPGIIAIATTFPSFEGADAPIAGTISIAGPLSRIDDQRVAELVPMLHRAARQLTEVWPLRRRHPVSTPLVPDHAGAPSAAALHTTT